MVLKNWFSSGREHLSRIAVVLFDLGVGLDRLNLLLASVHSLRWNAWCGWGWWSSSPSSPSCLVLQSPQKS